MHEVVARYGSVKGFIGFLA